MLPKIKSEFLNNVYYSVNNVNSPQVNISYMDYQYSTTSSTTTFQNGNGSYPITISPNIYTKTIKLDYLEISLNPFMNINNMNVEQLIFSQIRNEIDKSYIKKLTELGKKHRISAPVNSLDINIKDIKLQCEPENKSVSRNIISKFMMANNYIATIGRIGPAQWLMSNSKTYRYILSILDSNDLTFVNNNIMFGNIPYVVNDLIDDDIMLLGRKNDVTTTGIHCFILTDDNGYIYFQEDISSMYNLQKQYRIYYKIEDYGSNPEYNFLQLNTRTISYYRAKKLQRIKDVYGQ